MDPLLTPEEVAAILRVTPRTVRRYGAAGTLERVAIGGRIRRYTASSVEALIAPSTSEGPAASGTLAKECDHDARHQPDQG